MPKRIAIISTHPIQYNAPFFALLSKEENVSLKVFYTWGRSSMNAKFDPDFGKKIEWDIPLLLGYNYEFVSNVSNNPGSHHFYGIINPTLNQEIEKWGAQVVWVWGWSFNSHLKAIRHFQGKIEVWFRGDSTLLDEKIGFSLKKMMRRLFLKWVYSHVDIAFYVGSNNKDYFIVHGLQYSQLIYAPHAVDNDRFIDITGEYGNLARKWRKELGIDEDKHVLLFVGKFEKKKNPFLFLTILKNLEKDDFIGIMIGAGKLEGELKKSATKNVIFLPFQNQSKMPVVYRLGDALVMTSSGPGESWGLAINEALASGIKVFASDKCGGAIDLLREEYIFQFDQMPIHKLKTKIKEGMFEDNKINYHTFQNVISSLPI